MALIQFTGLTSGTATSPPSTTSPSPCTRRVTGFVGANGAGKSTTSERCSA